MKPPWFSLLPIFEEGITEDGIGIFAGVVYGIRNLCVQIADGKLHVLKLPAEQDAGRKFWYYDEVHDTFLTADSEEGQVYGEVIVEESGFVSIEAGAAVAVQALVKSVVSFKVVPI